MCMYIMCMIGPPVSVTVCWVGQYIDWVGQLIHIICTSDAMETKFINIYLNPKKAQLVRARDC